MTYEASEDDCIGVGDVRRLKRHRLGATPRWGHRDQQPNYRRGARHGRDRQDRNRRRGDRDDRDRDGHYGWGRVRGDGDRDDVRYGNYGYGVYGRYGYGR